jgi:prophage DNA circulation protein
MAPTLYTPYFNDLYLRIEPPEDSGERALVTHEVVDADGAQLEDTGLRAQAYRFTCWFWGDNRDRNGVTFDDSATFLDYLTRRNAVHTYVHPLDGAVQVRVASWNRRMRSTSCIGFDVSVVVEPPAELVSQEKQLIVPTVEALYAQSAAAQMAAVADSARDAVGADGPSMLSKVLDAGKSLAAQFAGFRLVVRQFVAKVDTAIATVEGAAALVESSADSLTATIEWGTSLPGRLVGAVSSAMDRIATAYRTASDSPEQFLASFNTAVDALKQNVSEFRDVITVAAATQATATVAVMLESDEQQRSVVRALEQQAPVDIMGRTQSIEPLPQVLSIQELEYVTAQTRKLLNDAIAVAPGNRALHEMAIELQRWVNSIKLQRESIRTVQVDTVQPLYAVMLKYGINYRMAERILALNPQIANPSYVSGEVRIYG